MDGEAVDRRVCSEHKTDAKHNAWLKNAPSGYFLENY